MNGKQAAEYWFETRKAPRGWKCVLAGGENFSEREIGEEVRKDNGSYWGHACGETGAILVPVPKEETMSTYKIDPSHEHFMGVCPADERDLDEYENDMRHGGSYPSRSVQKGLAMGTCKPRHWTPRITHKFEIGQSVPGWWKLI